MLGNAIFGNDALHSCKEAGKLDNGEVFLFAVILHSPEKAMGRGGSLMGAGIPQKLIRKKGMSTPPITSTIIAYLHPLCCRA